MSYIYDILLNFNYNIYDFYEWNKNDKLTHIKKIPIFRIDRNTFKSIILNNVRFNLNFLKKVFNKTEIYSRTSKTIKYAFLLTDGIDVLALNISDKIKYSKLLIEEEVDILDIVNRLNKYSIDFEIIDKKEISYKTRLEKEMELKINSSIKKIKNNDELKYLYYDCFNEKENNISLIKKRLYNNLTNDNITKKINEFLSIKKY